MSGRLVRRLLQVRAGRGRAQGLPFCEGLGFLILILSAIYLGIGYYALLKPYVLPWLLRVTKPVRRKVSPCLCHR